MINSEFVSRVVNGLNSIDKDSHLSKRWILNIGRTKAESYIIQRWDEGGFILDHNVITNVKCLEMIEVDKIDCCDVEFDICGTLMRSKHKLPGLAYTSAGPTIVTVSNADGSMFFKYSDLRSLQHRLKRRYSDVADKYYFVVDGYIYIPNVHIELVNVQFFTMKRREALKLSLCDADDVCKSEWDYDFIMPIKQIEYIVSETIREVSLKIQIPTDENPDLDSNQKTKTTI